MFIKTISIFALIIVINLSKTDSRFQYTTFVCKTFDKTFGEFEYCNLKSANQSYKYISGKLKLHKLPLTNMMVNMALLKKVEKLQPFVYNITFDVCTLLDKPLINPVAQFMHSTQLLYTNLNQSCPVIHDLVLDNLPINYLTERFSHILPFPKGDYHFRMYWLSSQQRVAMWEFY